MGNDVDSRLTELEIKATLAEDLVERLNEVIVRQQEQIDLLMREVAQLARRAEPSDGDAAPFRSLRDEIPPHY